MANSVSSTDSVVEAGRGRLRCGGLVVQHGHDADGDEAEDDGRDEADHGAEDDGADGRTRRPVTAGRAADGWLDRGRALDGRVVENCHVTDSAAVIGGQPGTFDPSSARPWQAGRAHPRQRVGATGEGVLSARDDRGHRGLACIRGKYAHEHPDRPAFIMAVDRRSRHLPRVRGPGEPTGPPVPQSRPERLGHYSIFMENNDRYLESCAAGERSGSVLHVRQLVPHRRGTRLHRRQQRVDGRDHLARQALDRASRRSPATTASPTCSSSTTTGRAATSVSVTTRWRSPATRRRPSPTSGSGIADALLVGHDRSPERHHPPACPTSRPARCSALFTFLHDLWHYREDMIYLSPAPLYHSAPQAAVSLDDPQRRDRDHHGALRSRRVPPPRRALQRDPQPARADDVQPPAQAARGGTHRATTCRRWRSPSTPPPRARSRSRRR